MARMLGMAFMLFGHVVATLAALHLAVTLVDHRQVLPMSVLARRRLDGRNGCGKRRGYQNQHCLSPENRELKSDLQERRGGGVAVSG
jgi:hypothetical protein